MTKEMLALLSNLPRGVRRNSEDDSDLSHFYECEACGQAVDVRDLADVFHHEDAGHTPRVTQ